MKDDEDYKPPQYVMNRWKRACSCCPECNPHPCDGVKAGGMCDQMPCMCCDDDYEYFEEKGSAGNPERSDY